MALSGFPAAARRSLGDSQLRANLARATSTIRDKRGRVVDGAAGLGGAAGGGLGDQGRGAASAGPTSSTQLESAVVAAGGTGALGEDGDEACSIVAADRSVARRRRGGEGEVDRHRRDRAERAARRRGHPRRGDRPRRADHPARRRLPVAHPRSGDPSQPCRDPRHLPARARASRTSPTSRPRSPRPRGCTCGAKFLSARMGVSGANFAVAETGSVCVFESEGNGRMCTTLPEVLVTVMGVEKVVPVAGATWRCSSSCCRAPRPASGMNPYTSVWSGAATAATGRARVPPRAARQRPGAARSPTRSAARRCAASAAARA